MAKIKFYLSIITIVKNDQLGLEKTYLSLNNLIKYKFLFEWIIVDGTFTPLDKSFIKDLIPKVIEEKDDGIYNAMNKGLDYADGKYLLFLNAGDTLNNLKKIKYLKKILEGEINDILCFSWNQKSNNKQFYKIANLRKNKFTRLLRMPSSHQSMLYLRDKLKTTKFDTDFQICGDFALYLFSISKGWKYKIYNDIFLVTFVTDGISAKKPSLLAFESSKAIYKYSSANFFIKFIISMIIFFRGFLRYIFIMFLT